MANTITSATSVYMLSVAGVFSTAVQLQGWGVDEAFDTEAVDAAETQVGVDGFGVAGWIPREVPQTLTLIASSPSNALFDQWMAAEDAIQDILYCSATIDIPALSKRLSLAYGTLKRYTPSPNVKKVLQPRVYMIHWLPQPGIPAIVPSPM
jgi:hypothetical protein